MNGFLVIDKGAGWTSHDVVARVRRLAKQKRVGHTGTLDPDATGVLLVCLGQATRLVEYTMAHRKVYRAEIALGVETDTQDAGGSPIAQHDASAVSFEDLRTVLPRFTGEILQVPPMVSAVHHKGERLYDIARRGEAVERAARPVTVHRLEASHWRPGETAHATLEIACSAGTYIRTLCHDIGAALGVGGHMAALRRTAVGRFHEAEAITLDALGTLADGGRLAECLRPAADLLPDAWPRHEGTEAEAHDIRHGRPIPAGTDADHAAFLTDGRLLAVLCRDGDLWRPVKVFPES